MFFNPSLSTYLSILPSFNYKILRNRFKSDSASLIEKSRKIPSMDFFFLFFLLLFDDLSLLDIVVVDSPFNTPKSINPNQIKSIDSNFGS